MCSLIIEARCEQVALEWRGFKFFKFEKMGLVKVGDRSFFSYSKRGQDVALFKRSEWGIRKREGGSERGAGERASAHSALATLSCLPLSRKYGSCCVWARAREKRRETGCGGRSPCCGEFKDSIALGIAVLGFNPISYVKTAKL